MRQPEADNPLAHPEVGQASFTGYIAGYAISLLFLLAALLITVHHLLRPVPLLGTISGLAMLILLAQALLFFDVDFSRHHIWKSISLLLAVPLFILSIGLTAWMFHFLDVLTMLPMPGMTTQPTLLQ